MTTDSFKTDHGFIAKLTHDNYPIWKQKIRRVLIAKKEYDIVTGIEPLPVGQGVALRPQQQNWHERANDAMALIYTGCSDDLLPWIDDIDDPVEMWETLQSRLDNAASQVGRTQILCKFTAARLSSDEKITQYFTRLIAIRKKLIGTPEQISEETIKTYIFTTLSNEFEMTIKILEWQIPPPTAQEAMDALKEDAEQTTLTKEIGNAATGSALYTQHSGYRGRGCGQGRGGSGRGIRRGGDGRNTTYKCTYCKLDTHTTEDCRKRKLGLSKGEIDERTCYQCGLPGHLNANCIHYKRAQEQRTKIKKPAAMVTAMASLATAGDHDLL